MGCNWAPAQGAPSSNNQPANQHLRSAAGTRLLGAKPCRLNRLLGIHRSASALITSKRGAAHLGRAMRDERFPSRRGLRARCAIRRRESTRSKAQADAGQQIGLEKAAGRLRWPAPASAAPIRAPRRGRSIVCRGSVALRASPGITASRPRTYRSSQVVRSRLGKRWRCTP